MFSLAIIFNSELFAQTMAEGLSLASKYLAIPIFLMLLPSVFKLIVESFATEELPPTNGEDDVEADGFSCSIVDPLVNGEDVPEW